MSAGTAEHTERPQGEQDASERDEPIDADLLALTCAGCGHPHRTTRPTCAECGSDRLLISMHCSIARRDATTTPPASFAFVAIPLSLGIVALAGLNWIAVRNGWMAFIVAEVMLFVALAAIAGLVMRSAESRVRWRRRATRWGTMFLSDVVLPTLVITLLFTAVALSLESSSRPFAVIPVVALLLLIAIVVRIARHGADEVLAPFRRMIQRRGAWQQAPMRLGRPVPISEIVEIRQGHGADPRCLHFVASDGWLGDVEVRETAERAIRITAYLRTLLRRQRAVR
jgi:hypothetical protein